MTLGRFFRDNTDYYAGPQTQRAISRTLATVREVMEQLKEEKVAFDELKALEVFYSDKLRSSSKRISRERAQQIVKRHVSEADHIIDGIKDIVGENWEDTYERIYNIYESAVQQVIIESNYSEEIKFLDALLREMEVLQDQVVVDDECNRPMEALERKPSKKGFPSQQNWYDTIASSVERRQK